MVDKIGYRGYYDKTLEKAFSTRGNIINDLDDRDFKWFDYSDFQYNDEILAVGRSSFDREKLKEKASPSKYLQITNMLDSLVDEEDPVVLNIIHLKK